MWQALVSQSTPTHPLAHMHLAAEPFPLHFPCPLQPMPQPMPVIVSKRLDALNGMLFTLEFTVKSKGFACFFPMLWPNLAPGSEDE